MVTTQHYWLWSLPVLYIIRIGPSASTPTSIRSNGAVLAEIKQPPCSQQLEKLKAETRRHISALEAITGNSVSTAWRNRRLLSSTQPIVLKAKPLPTTLFTAPVLSDERGRMPAKTEEAAENSLTKYLNSLDHSGWVSKCHNGNLFRCAMNEPENKATEKQASEELGSAGKTTKVSDGVPNNVTLESTNDKTSPIEGLNETNKLEIEVRPQNSQQMESEISPVPVNKFNATVFDLLPSSYNVLKDTGCKTYNLKLEGASNEKNRSPFNQTTPTTPDHKQKVLNKYDDDSRIFAKTLNEENTNDRIEQAEDTKNRTMTVPQKVNTEASLSSLTDMDQRRPEPIMRSDSLTVDEHRIPINSLRAPSANRLVHCNKNFLPLTIQLTPLTYYQRYPRENSLSGQESLETNTASESTFPLNSRKPIPTFNHSIQPSLLSKNNGALGVESSDMETLDGLASTYGNDIIKRVSTGKRESEFYNSKKEAITTNYPEAPSSQISPGTFDSQLRTTVAPGENGNDSTIYLFLGGNWLANFKGSPQLFYMQPGSHQLTSQPFKENNADSRPLSHQQLPTSMNPNCPNRNLAVPFDFNLPPSYLQPSYAVSEKNSEQNFPSSYYNARSSTESKIPSTIAARNGYSWYDPAQINGQFSGRPVAFPNSAGLSNIAHEKMIGSSKSKMDDFNYEDSLVNFPPRKYEPPVVGLHDFSAVKPEELMEHDINTSDMFIVGTQVLAALPLTPSEYRADDSNDTAYGKLVADVSSRSSPGTLRQDPDFTAFTNTLFRAHKMINPQRVQAPNPPEYQAPSTYFQSPWPSEFEFVSGQWIKRKPGTDMSTREYIYDQVGRRGIRDVVVGWPGMNPSSDIHQPAHLLKPKCLGKTKRSDHPLNVFKYNIPPQQEGQPEYFENSAYNLDYS